MLVEIRRVKAAILPIDCFGVRACAECSSFVGGCANGSQSKVIACGDCRCDTAADWRRRRCLANRTTPHRFGGAAADQGGRSALPTTVSTLPTPALCPAPLNHATRPRDAPGSSASTTASGKYFKCSVFQCWKLKQRQHFKPVAFPLAKALIALICWINTQRSWRSMVIPRVPTSPQTAQSREYHQITNNPVFDSGRDS